MSQPVVKSFKNHILTLSWSLAEMRGNPNDISYIVELLSAALTEKGWQKIATGLGNAHSANIQFYLLGTYQFRVHRCYKNDVTVSSKPSVLYNFTAQNGSPKLICDNLKPIVIGAGESLSISAKIQGEPTPRIYWNLRNKPILLSKNVLIENTQRYTRLICFNIRQNHSGIYEIKAVNKYGIDTAYVEVTVIDDMSVPILSRASLNHSSDLAELNMVCPTPEENAYNVNIPGPPNLTGAPVVAFKDNYCLELSWTPPQDIPVSGYIIEAKDGPFGMPWRKISLTRETKCHAVIYFYVRGFYSYRISAFNDVWKGKPSEASELISCILKNGAPKFYLDEFYPVVVNATKSFGFLIKIQGDPPPTVTWCKNGMPIEGFPGLIVTNTSYDTGLMCNCADAIHSGTYQVVASNVHGIYAAVVDVSVIECTSALDVLAFLTHPDLAFDEDLIEITNNYILAPEILQESSKQESSQRGISTHVSEFCDSTSCESHTPKTVVNVVQFNEQSQSTPLTLKTSKWDDINMTKRETCIVSEDKEDYVQSEAKENTSDNKLFTYIAYPSLTEDSTEITNNDILDPEILLSSKHESSENEVPIHNSSLRDNTNCELLNPETYENHNVKFCPFPQRPSKCDTSAMTFTNTVSEDSLQREDKDQSSELRPPFIVDDFNQKNQPLHQIVTDNDCLSREENSLEVPINEEDSDKPVLKENCKSPCLSINKSYELQSQETEKLLESETAANIITNVHYRSDKPPEPTGPLLVSNICKIGCELKWNPPDSDDEHDLEGYLVEKLDPDIDLWIPEAFISDTEIEISNLISGKSYEFRVKAFYQTGESKPLQSSKIVIPGDSLESWDSCALLYFCSEKLLTDVELNVYDETYCVTLYAHKLILSLWSPVFADKLSKQNANDNCKIPVTDIAPRVFEVVLKFMYGVPSDFYRQINDLGFILEVYKAAVIYEIEYLSNMCCKIFLSIFPSAKDAFQLLDAGTLINSEIVRNRCLKILQTQTVEVLAAQEMSSVTISMVATILNLPSVSFPSEYELIKWVLDWATQNMNQREIRATIEELRPLMNFLVLNAKEFGTLFQKCSELMSKEDGFNIFMNLLIPGSCELPQWCSSPQSRIFNQ